MLWLGRSMFGELFLRVNPVNKSNRRGFGNYDVGMTDVEEMKVIGNFDVGVRNVDNLYVKSN